MDKKRIKNNLSVTERLDVIYSNFNNQFSLSIDLGIFYIDSVFDDYVIICKGSYDNRYRVNYSFSNNKVIFDEPSKWVKVKRVVSYEEVKHNALKTISKTDTEMRVANYMVLFGGIVKGGDLTGERFIPTALEAFESEYTKTGFLHVDWEHGLDPDALGNHKDNVLGYVDWKTAKIDEKGLFVERVLSRRAKYMEYLETLIEEGLIGNSSEAAEYKKTKDGDILEWRLKRDSLTVMPAEPRMMSSNAIQAIKSLGLVVAQEEDATDLQSEQEVAETEGDKQKINIEILGVKKMSEATTTPEYVSKQEFADLSGKLDAVLKHIQDEPAIRKSGYVSNDGGKADPNVKSFGDFLTAVQRGDDKRLKEVYGAQKTLGESNGSSAAVLVPEDYNTELFRVAYEASPVLNMVTKVPVNTKSGTYPALDVTITPTAGVGQTPLAAGVKGAKRAENGAYTETDPQFYEIKWDINDFASGYTQTSKEFRADSPQAIETLLTSLFGVAVSSKLEYGVFRGSGIGEPLGILNAPAKLGVTPATDNLFSYVDAMSMASKAKKLGSKFGWFYHPSILPDFANAAWTQGNNIMSLTGMGYGGAYTSDHLPQANSSGCVVWGDFSAYLLFLRGALEISYSEHAGFMNGKDTWRFSQRADGQPWLKGAITLPDPQGGYQVSPFVFLND